MTEGYVVLAYTARGFGDSGGRIHLNDPDFEVADASALLDLLAERPEVVQDGPGDPRVAVVGGSYGGALALMAAGADPRVDSVVAMITWHDLAEAFYPQHATASATPGPFKQLWASSFFTMAIAPAAAEGPGGAAERSAPDSNPLCGRFDPQVCAMFLSAAEDGTADSDAALIELLRRHSPAPTLDRVQAPTYLVQGMSDSLFGLEHADATARALVDAGVPVAVRWFNGGHDGDGGVRPVSEQDADGPAAAAAQTTSAERAAQAEAEQQRESLARWLGSTLADDPSVPLPGLTYTMALQRGQDVARSFNLADYADVDGSTQLSLQLAESMNPALVLPPGGVPAATTVVPGLGALAGAPIYPLAALPGQHVAFDTEPLTEAFVVAGTPRLSLEVTSTGPASTLFVSLWRVEGEQASLPRQLVAPIRVETVPGQPQTVEVDLPTATWDLPVGSTWRVLVSATDTAYRAGAQARLDQVSLADPVLRLPVLGGTPVARPGLWDTEALGVVAAIVVALLWLGVAGLRRRARPLSADLDLADVPLVVQGLTKAFPDGHRAVDAVSWRAERGQVVGLLGPNGAGKTTTLRMVTGLIHPDAGQVHVLGEPVRPGAPVLGRLGALIEGPGFLPHLSGRANLDAYWAATGRPAEESRIEEALAVAALGDAIERPVKAYSHGMKQRLGVAQAMLGMPEVLILDEPTNGLDPPQIAALRPILQRYAAGGRTVVVSSHLLAEVELTCSHVVVMHAGRVVATGAVADLGVRAGRNLEEVFLSTIAGLDTAAAAHDDSAAARTERLRQVRPR